MTYQRIVLKLSGEALAHSPQLGIKADKLALYTKEIVEAYETKTQIIIIIGGGNLWRGKNADALAIKPTEAHIMGMLATLINSLALREALQQQQIPVTLLSRLPVPTVCPAYQPNHALQALAQNNVVIVGGGLGNAFFSTDTAAITTALDLEADICLKGTKVDGVFPTDPILNPESKPYDEITLATAYEKKLHVMDMTAFSLAQENKMPIIIYNAQQEGSLKRILYGEKIGTLLKPEG